MLCGCGGGDAAVGRVRACLHACADAVPLADAHAITHSWPVAVAITYDAGHRRTLVRATDGWQWQLSGTINASYTAAVYDIDLFDAPSTTIAALHGAGRRVVYFSAGSAENWRSDYSRFVAADLGNPLDGWAGERRWTFRSPTSAR
ncbi:endo alpha-1,4 polygalactosaminidase [Sphingomonas sp. MMS24-JH45]